MLTDTSENSSSDGTSSFWRRRRLASLTELEAEIRSNTNLVCVDNEQVQSASAVRKYRCDNPFTSTMQSNLMCIPLLVQLIPEIKRRGCGGIRLTCALGWL